MKGKRRAEKKYLDQIEMLFKMYDKGEISIEKFHRHLINLDRKEDMPKKLRGFLSFYISAVHRVKNPIRNARRFVEHDKGAVVKAATSYSDLNSIMITKKREGLVSALNVIKKLVNNETSRNALYDIYEIEFRNKKNMFKKKDVLEEVEDLLKKLKGMDWVDGLSPRSKN